jgi:RNA polymerase sigma factor (sigma-70 family)
VSSDRDLVAGSGESPALFGELYDRHAVRIHRYAAGRLGQQAADDVMAETFLVAFERRSVFDPHRGDVLPWLFGIATTLIRKHARLEAQAWRATVAAGGAASHQPDLNEVETRLDAQNSVATLAVALRRMAPGDRDVLLLYAWADLEYAQIATALGIPVGTVRSRLNRARRLLQKAHDRGSAPDKEAGHGRNAPATPSS